VALFIDKKVIITAYIYAIIAHAVRRKIDAEICKSLPPDPEPKDVEQLVRACWLRYVHGHITMTSYLNHRDYLPPFARVLQDGCNEFPLDYCSPKREVQYFAQDYLASLLKCDIEKGKPYVPSTLLLRVGPLLSSE
jgi:hypothetical protein